MMKNKDILHSTALSYTWELSLLISKKFGKKKKNVATNWTPPPPATKLPEQSPNEKANQRTSNFHGRYTSCVGTSHMCALVYKDSPCEAASIRIETKQRAHFISGNYLKSAQQAVL
jgi:hypothetical protein